MGHMATSRSFYEILGIAQDAQPEAGVYVICLEEALPSYPPLRC